MNAINVLPTQGKKRKARTVFSVVIVFSCLPKRLLPHAAKLRYNTYSQHHNAQGDMDIKAL